MQNEKLSMHNSGQPEHGEVIIYQSSDGRALLDVHLAAETVWLTQAQMAELFDRNKRTISEHLRNVFKESELEEEVVVRKFRTTTRQAPWQEKPNRKKFNITTWMWLSPLATESNRSVAPSFVSGPPMF